MEGISVNSGFPSKEFLKENEDSLEMKECLIIACADKINNYENVVKLLEFAKNTNKSLVLFSPMISQEIQSMFVFNNNKNSLNVKLSLTLNRNFFKSH